MADTEIELRYTDDLDDDVTVLTMTADRTARARIIERSHDGTSWPHSGQNPRAGWFSITRAHHAPPPRLNQPRRQADGCRAPTATGPIEPASG